MSRPIRLGIVFSYRESWIGGSYYLLNLISALKELEQSKRPEITVFSSSEADLVSVRELGYPDATYRVLREHQPGKLLRLGNRLSAKILGRPLVQPLAIGGGLDIVYPARSRASFRTVPHRLFWIPDFQEEYLPEMFGQQRVDNRRRVRGRLAREARHIVFSSQDAARDFRRFYPESRAKAHVLNFAVTHPDLSGVDAGELRLRYCIDEKPFFLVSNQFWKHKNHKVVLDALRVMSSNPTREEYLVCFSGKEEDARNPGYACEIRDLVERYGLQNRVRFLGFMERVDQLRLMQDSLAVIQPSLFEGWSTVIEDAKALEVPVIASDLPVHVEQLGQDGTFFARTDANELAKEMERALLDRPRTQSQTNYATSVIAFGERFVDILERIVRADDSVSGLATSQ